MRYWVQARFYARSACLLDRLFNTIEQLLVFARAAAVQPSGKHRNDFQDILGKVFLEGCIRPMVENDHLDILCLANGEYQFRAESKQPVLSE